MKMLFVGDPHGLYQYIIDAVVEQQPSSCILMGDQCYNEPIDQLFADIDGVTALHWIYGNQTTDRREWHASLLIHCGQGREPAWPCRTAFRYACGRTRWCISRVDLASGCRYEL